MTCFLSRLWNFWGYIEITVNVIMFDGNTQVKDDGGKCNLTQSAHISMVKSILFIAQRIEKVLLDPLTIY